jgi:hypothetical protein
MMCGKSHYLWPLVITSPPCTIIVINIIKDHENHHRALTNAWLVSSHLPPPKRLPPRNLVFRKQVKLEAAVPSEPLPHGRQPVTCLVLPCSLHRMQVRCQHLRWFRLF